MNKIVKYGYVFSLIGILFLMAHSIAPHSHEDIVSNESFKQDGHSSIEDILFSILTIELDINHLKDLRTSNFVDFTLILNKVFTFDIFQKEVKQEHPIYSDVSLYTSSHLHSNHSLRAPPIV